MYIVKLLTQLVFFLSLTVQVYGQNDHDTLVTRVLGNTPLIDDLKELVDQIGGRVTGTKANEAAIMWGLQKFKEAGVKAHTESFEMPSRWIPKSTLATVITDNGSTTFNPLVVSKYKSKTGVYQSKLVYLSDIDSLSFAENQALIKDRFVLVESDLCYDIDGLFAEYIMAKKVEDLAHQYQAAGIVFMASRPAKLLYRFISSTGDQESIPQLVMAREDAQRCIRLLELGKKLDIKIHLSAETGGSYKADNVIAEIRGTELPEEIIIIGAHIDSWALGTGANDNGCNVAMMIDLARQMVKTNIQAKRTIRFALWNGEEQGYFGSHAYTVDHASELDQHKLAISIDIGSGDILGYFTNGRAELLPIMDEILAQVTQLGTFTNMNIPIVGTDNFDFMLQGVPNLVARHKPDLYGLNYHAASDTYDKVNLKSLKTNAAIVASTILQYANMSKSQLESIVRHDRNAVSRIIEEHQLEFTMKMFDVWNTWVKGTRGLTK